MYETQGNVEALRKFIVMAEAQRPHKFEFGYFDDERNVRVYECNGCSLMKFRYPTGDRATVMFGSDMVQFDPDPIRDFAECSGDWNT